MAKKIRLFISVLLVAISCAGCLFVLPDRSIMGRVNINGAAPERQIIVTYSINGAENDIPTDSSGNFTISSGYKTGDKAEIFIKTTKSYQYEDALVLGLNSWTCIGEFTVNTGNKYLPTLDLFNYGMQINKPLRDETINSFPYEVQFGEYNKAGVSGVFYWLNFYDTNDSYIGSSDKFYKSSYFFNGILKNGSSLAIDTYWYLGSSYQKSGYDIYLYSYGALVYYGIGITGLSQKSQIVEEILRPVYY